MSTMTPAIYRNAYGNPRIGYVPMPADFPYKEILEKGRPRHDPMSRFRLKHPEMPCSRRAKIFAPFDALRGFNEAVASKEILYAGKPELGEDEKEDLDRKLAVLSRLTFSRRAAKANTPVITVTYYLPCPDEYNDAYGVGGTLETMTGVCSRVDTHVTHTIRVGEHDIPLEDVTSITGEVLDLSHEHDINYDVDHRINLDSSDQDSSSLCRYFSPSCARE